MKKQILINCIIVLITLTASMGQIIAQNTADNKIVKTEVDKNDNKLSVFVMDFSVNDTDYKKEAKFFTDDFETEIISNGKYNVLPRRDHADIIGAIEVEREVFEAFKLPPVLRNTLNSKAADAVFHGRLKLDDGSGQFELEVRLQPMDINIPTLKKAQILFGKGLISDNSTRKSIARDMVKQLFAKEAVALKEEQLNIIEGKLSSYRARVKEVIDVFEEKIDYLLIMSTTELKPHLEEIDQKRMAFNEIWNDLNANKVKYTKDFSKYWGNDSKIALEYVYSETMEDFHPEFKSYINYLQTRINIHRKTNFKKKKRRKEANDKLAQEIKRELLKILDEDYYTDVDKKINAFLNALRAEIIEELKQLN